MQLNASHRLNADVGELKAQVQQLTLKLGTSQTDAESEDFARQGAEAAAQSLRQHVKVLLTEIEDQKQITATAKADLARQENDFTSEMTERMSQQEAQLKE